MMGVPCGTYPVAKGFADSTTLNPKLVVGQEKIIRETNGSLQMRSLHSLQEMLTAIYCGSWKAEGIL